MRYITQVKVCMLNLYLILTSILMLHQMHRRKRIPTLTNNLEVSEHKHFVRKEELVVPKNHPLSRSTVEHKQTQHLLIYVVKQTQVHISPILYSY